MVVALRLFHAGLATRSPRGRELAVIAEHRRHAQRTPDEWVDQYLAGQPWEKVIGAGVPHKEIVRLAEEQGAGLIVIGMHGHGYLAHALSGSTAERVLHRANRPVLAVPHS